jgi:hypothetical protein
MNNEKFLELDNNEMCIVNGGSTKVAGAVFGIASSLLGLGSYIAGKMGNSELSGGLAGAAGITGTIALGCAAVPAP